jgi:hypothetical protein
LEQAYPLFSLLQLWISRILSNLPI